MGLLTSLLRWRLSWCNLQSAQRMCNQADSPKDGTSQGHGTSSSLQAQRMVLLTVFHGEHRRLGWQSESSAAEAGNNLGQQQRHQRRSRLALQIKTAACATAWTGVTTRTRVYTSTTTAGGEGVRRSIFTLSTAPVTLAPC